MAYNKTNWQNLPSTNTPVYDVNLNKIENKLSDLDTNKANLATTPQTPSGDTHVNTVSLGYNDGGWALNINANTSGQNINFTVGIDELNSYYNKSNIYSTNEKRIGTWINGKPLYRRVLYLTSGWSINNEVILSHNISNVDEIWLEKAFYKRSDGFFEMTPNVHRSMSEWGSGIYDIGTNTFNLWIGSLGSNLSINYINIVFNYTKTTD